MIERLTPEQEAKFPEYVEKFTKLGKSTKQLTDESKEQIVEILGRVYEAGGLPAPKKVLFFTNPYSMSKFAKDSGDT